MNLKTKRKKYKFINEDRMKSAIQAFCTMLYSAGILDKAL